MGVGGICLSDQVIKAHFPVAHPFPVFPPISGFVEILKKYDINQYKGIYGMYVVGGGENRV